MTNLYELASKAWQIHDVLKTLSAALPEDRADCDVPVHGVVSMLMGQAQDVADKLSDAAFAANDVRSDAKASGSKEDV
ncbi:hypothetical protein [Caballeronia sp. HLA56]